MLASQSDAVFDCSTCGTQTTCVIRVDWHLNDYPRIMLSINQSKIDGGNDGAEITGVGASTQVDR